MNLISHNKGKKLILNFIWQGGGGGVQNAMSFIETLPLIDDPHKYRAITRQASVLSQQAHKHGIECLEIEGDFLSLHRFALTCRKIFLKGQICFNFFGPLLLSTYGYLLNICGVAYSNLYYPELEFWKQFHGLPRLKHELWDRVRMCALSKADYWIFETQVLADRAVRLAKYPAQRIGVVQMTASSLVSKKRVDKVVVDAFNRQLPRGFRFLFLASAAPNKRIDKAAAIARHLQSMTDQRFVFVTTMAQDSPYYRKVIEDFNRQGVADHLYNVGTCPYNQVASLISTCDSMCLFSVLESFSNNFVEAWAMEKPLISSDYDWSRSGADKAALYVDPERPIDAAAQMARLMNDQSLQISLINKGIKRLKCYPSTEEKCRMYLRCIDEARAQGFMTLKERRKLVRWSCAKN